MLPGVVDVAAEVVGGVEDGLVGEVVVVEGGAELVVVDTPDEDVVVLEVLDVVDCVDGEVVAVVDGATVVVLPLPLPLLPPPPPLPLLPSVVVGRAGQVNSTAALASSV